MIKFFRKIRQNLIETGNTAKYIKYAIGEIILVVIGILIALAINNWNENSKEKKLGINILERIHNDLVQDTILFRKTIETNNKTREDIRGLLKTMYSGVDDKKQVEMMSSVFDQALDQIFSYNSTTYNSIIGSGTLTHIDNVELKEDIVGLYHNYEEVDKLLSAINQWMLSVTSTLDTNTNFIKFNSQVSDIYTSELMVTENDFAFINDQKSEEFQMLVRAISATAFNQKVRNSYYEDLITKCASLLLKIETELD